MFVLNLIWELFHYQLYNDLSRIPKYLHILLAVFADTLIIVGIFLLISFKNKNFGWIEKPRFVDYFVVIFFGIVIAILIESWALFVGRWSYRETMPLLYGLGISPLVQLFVTAILSLKLTKFLIKY